MWRQGEHVALIGSTGSGKTTLARELLKLRGYTLCVITKPDFFLWPGRWKRVQRAKDIDLGESTHFVLRPAYEEQQYEITRAIENVWIEGGWTLYFDEAYYIQQALRLEDRMVQMLTQGRSLSITVMLGIQRPAWVTRFALSEPTHMFCARLGDARDISTIKSIVGQEYADAVVKAPYHKFVHLDKISGEQMVVDKTTVIKQLMGGK
jgi:energy-coupling factor transporter ATP-binding protein EcfA2